MDSATEEVITNNALELFKDKTVIVVAHRLQTVRNVDRIVVLDEGRVIQDGKFEGLISQEGKFKELWEKQTRE